MGKYSTTIEINPASLNDVPIIQRVFRISVMETYGHDYSAEQIETWANAFDDPKRLIERIQNDYFLVLLADGECAGFASLDNDLVDLLYVSPSYQRLGLATMLYKKLEERVLETCFSKIKTHASATAAPFFKKMGFRPISPNVETVDNVSITNLIMEKELAP